MKKRFTTERTYNGKEIQMQDGTRADCKVLEAIDTAIDTANRAGGGTMVLYEVQLPSQYNQGNANRVFMETQAAICKQQKRQDRADTTPRYIAVRDARSKEAPRYRVAMFLPKETTYEKSGFEQKATEIANGKMSDWTAFQEHDLLGICERHGVKVCDSVPLDGSAEASDEAFYVASQLAAVKVEPRAERTLFRSRSKASI